MLGVYACSKVIGTDTIDLPLMTSYCCDFETMVSRLECTRVQFVQVSVWRPDGVVSRPKQFLTTTVGEFLVVTVTMHFFVFI